MQHNHRLFHFAFRILVLVGFIGFASTFLATISTPSDELARAIARADVEKVTELLKQGADCNARFGEKKRTALMISVDHLAGNLLELEEEMVAKTSYIDWIGGACIAVGVGLLGWWWIKTPAKENTPNPPVVAQQSESPASPDQPQEPNPAQPSAGQQNAPPLVIELTPEPATPIPPVGGADQKDEKHAATEPVQPTIHLQVPPAARVPKDGPAIPVEVKSGAVRDANVQQPPTGPQPQPQSRPANVPQEPNLKQRWKRFKTRVKNVFTGCAPTPQPDTPPRQPEPVRPEEPKPVMPQFYMPLGGAAVAAGVAAVSKQNGAVKRSQRSVNNRVSIIRTLLQSEHIDCQAQDTDGKTVLDLFDACQMCKLKPLKEIWQKVRELIVGHPH